MELEAPEGSERQRAGQEGKADLELSTAADAALVPAASTVLRAEETAVEPDEEQEGYWEWLDEPVATSRSYVREVVVLLDDQRSVKVDAHDLAVTPGRRVLVEREEGHGWGQVRSPVQVRMKSSDLPRIVRLEGKGDQRRGELQRSREEEAFRYCQEKIRERKLPMKLVRVQYQQNGSKAVFCFGAEGRIDFRQLVRDLAQRFHTRIEMRQIGVRDEAKTLGGIGICGLALCCRAHLEGFAPVSIRMAKTQNLSLNPQKVSGQCGRLLCCLNYEQRTYEELRKGLPKVGSTVETPRGPGKVRDLDVLRRRLLVQLDNGPSVAFFADKPDEGEAGGGKEADGTPRKSQVLLTECKARKEAVGKEREESGGYIGELPELGSNEVEEAAAPGQAPVEARQSRGGWSERLTVETSGRAEQEQPREERRERRKRKQEEVDHRRVRPVEPRAERGSGRGDGVAAKAGAADGHAATPAAEATGRPHRSRRRGRGGSGRSTTVPGGGSQEASAQAAGEEQRHQRTSSRGDAGTRRREDGRTSSQAGSPRLSASREQEEGGPARVSHRRHGRGRLHAARKSREEQGGGQGSGGSGSGTSQQ